MNSQREQCFLAHPLSDLTRIPITRVNARVPMNRAEQRLMLLVWTCSICTVLLTISTVIELACRLLNAMGH